MDNSERRNLNADGKRFFIVGSVVIFVAAIGAMILVIIGPPDNFSVCEKIRQGIAEKKDLTGEYDITEINECERDIECSFDSQTCEIPCPLGFQMDRTGCEISCQCASSSMGRFQGDIQFDDVDVHTLLIRYGYASTLEANAIIAKSDVISGVRLWPKKLQKVFIPYVINVLDTQLWNAIQTAIHAFEGRTCIEFVKRDGQKDYLAFDEGFGCWSRVGMSGGKQSIGLGSGCRAPGLVLHQVMHALGFEHEHVRPDRDGYIRVNFDNIRKEKVANFAKIQGSNETWGSPYDITSTTHIGSLAWTSDREKYTFTKSDGEPIFGQQAYLSSYDVMKTNYLYNCNDQKQFPPDAASDDSSIWLEWTSWSKCTGTCGTSKSVRHRSCEGGNPKCPYGGEWQRKTCKSPSFCPGEDGQWLPWESWEQCSRTCSLGYQWRKRKCQEGGSLCKGNSFKGRYCVHPPCPS